VGAHNKGNTIAVVTNETRVLGLGDIGPEAGMPGMEGKALLLKYLGGVDAVPICLDTKDAALFIQTVKLLQSSFGGINLEDISKPACFRILDTLRDEVVDYDAFRPDTSLAVICRSGGGSAMAVKSVSLP
jgi:malate dehydrogenase (oxaloacetate-decarboxylating)